MKDVDKLKKLLRSLLINMSVNWWDMFMCWGFMKRIQLHNYLILTQNQTISVQTGLSAWRTEQLGTLKGAVKSSVVEMESVKAETRTNSSIVAILWLTVKVINIETLKNVFKLVVEREDCRRNAFLFGFSDKSDRELSEAISEVFLIIG